MTIEVKELEDGSFDFTWDKNHPLESQLNTWTEQDFINAIMSELNETNYCDQKPVNLELTFEEHALLNDILCNAVDSADMMLFYDGNALPEIPRYQMLQNLKENSYSLWKNRFGNGPYNND